MARPKEFDRDIALQKAMVTFWAKGYEGTSIADLTESMGISRSSLYETFGDKHALFLEALNHYLAQTDRKRANVFSNASSIKQGMNTFFQGIIQFILDAEHPSGCFYTNTATAIGTLNEEIRAVIKLGSEKMEHDFYTLFLRGQQNGEIGIDKDLHALARYFVGLVRGISVMARIQTDREALADIVEVGLKVLD